MQISFWSEFSFSIFIEDTNRTILARTTQSPRISNENNIRRDALCVVGSYKVVFKVCFYSISLSQIQIIYNFYFIKYAFIISTIFIFRKLSTLSRKERRTFQEKQNYVETQIKPLKVIFYRFYDILVLAIHTEPNDTHTHTTQLLVYLFLRGTLLRKRWFTIPIILFFVFFCRRNFTRSILSKASVTMIYEDGWNSLFFVIYYEIPISFFIFMFRIKTMFVLDKIVLKKTQKNWYHRSSSSAIWQVC